MPNSSLIGKEFSFAQADPMNGKLRCKLNSIKPIIPSFLPSESA